MGRFQKYLLISFILTFFAGAFIFAQTPAKFNVVGTGSYCAGSSGLSVSLSGSEAGVDYQLRKNGINDGAPVSGTGSVLVWLNQTEGVYEIVATNVSSLISEKMDGKAIVIKNPQPVVTFGYGYEKRLTIDADQVAGTQDLINFPMLVSIPNDNNLRTVGNGGNVQNSNGYDIVFTDSNNNPIPFERISYNPSTGAYSAWVKISVVSYNTDTDIHMLYGKSGIITDHSSRQTWDTDYIQVMHLDGDFTDVSLAGNYGVNDGTSDSEGKIGFGRSYDGINDKIIFNNDAELDGTNDEATFSLWIKWINSADGDYQIVMSSSNRFSVPNGGYEWASQGTGNHYFYPNGTSGSNYNLGPNPFTNNTWQYLAVTLMYNTKTLKIFVNGIPISLTTIDVPAFWTSLATIDDWLWGGNPDIPSRYFNGYMDEIRVQNIARSGDWLLTEYTNQNNPSGFYTISAETPFAPLADLCPDNSSYLLNQAKPEGGSYSGTGVSGGIFYPQVAGAGNHTITYNYTDGFGCISSGSKIQTVLGLPTPTITGNNTLCPNASLEMYSTPGVAGNSYYWTITGSGASITSGQGTNQITVNWGTTSGTIKVTETINATGCNYTTADFIVTVGDVTNPVIISPDNLTALCDISEQPAYADYAAFVNAGGSASDNCGINAASFTLASEVSDGLIGLETVTRTYSIADLCGNTVSLIQKIVISENEDPIIVCSSDIVQSVDPGSCYATVTVPIPITSDNCGIGSVSNDFNGLSDASGSYPAGTTTLTWTVTDLSGNSAICVHTITVTDNEKPRITCPGDKTEYLISNCEFIIPDYTTLASGNDNCDPSPVITQTPVAGTIISGIGTVQPITLTSTDYSGNFASCKFNIVLQDNIPPVITCLPDTTINSGKGIYKIEVLLSAPQISDNCSIQSVINDFNGGANASGIYNTGTTLVTYTVTDISGNISNCSRRVTIQSGDDMLYGIVIPQGFSPNQDGLNDFFEIIGIGEYPENELRVFNINGAEVYSRKPYDNSWDGKSSGKYYNGVKLPTGTYFYVLTLERDKVVKGYVYLIFDI